MLCNWPQTDAQRPTRLLVDLAVPVGAFVREQPRLESVRVEPDRVVDRVKETIS
jgi:hypothetical protein